MNREETIALWERCEVARADAQARGKTQEQAAMAFTSVWNAKMEELTATRDRLSEREWFMFGQVDFSNVLFQQEGSRLSDEINQGAYRIVKYRGLLSFSNLTFPGLVRFDQAMFSSYVWFDHTTFPHLARFAEVVFLKSAAFRDCHFMKNAFFDETIFHENTFFSGTTFDSGVQFTRATFSGWTIFDKTHFAGHAGFTAIRVTGAFDLANARFERVPDFVQAHFDEGPRLDHIRVRERMTEPGRAWTFPARLSKGVYRRVFHPRPDVPVRYRALRRLAIQGLDSDRALSFFAGEVRSARLNGDWPLPWPPWRSKGWAGVVRFWIGVAYELLSGFGRSVVLPFMWWCLVSAVFVVYYLGQSPDVRSERTSSPDHGITRYVSVSLSELLYKHPCWAKTPSSPEELTPLTQSVRVQTSAAIEAVHLSLRNALIILDSNNDATLRTYGCLYGVDRNNGNPVAFVPSSVSFASVVQKLVSGVLIFLLGLGIRNLLKMK